MPGSLGRIVTDGWEGHPSASGKDRGERWLLFKGSSYPATLATFLSPASLYLGLNRQRFLVWGTRTHSGAKIASLPNKQGVLHCPSSCGSIPMSALSTFAYLQPNQRLRNCRPRCFDTASKRFYCLMPRGGRCGWRPSSPQMPDTYTIPLPGKPTLRA